MVLRVWDCPTVSPVFVPSSMLLAANSARILGNCSHLPRSGPLMARQWMDRSLFGHVNSLFPRFSSQTWRVRYILCGSRVLGRELKRIISQGYQWTTSNDVTTSNMLVATDRSQNFMQLRPMVNPGALKCNLTMKHDGPRMRLEHFKENGSRSQTNRESKNPFWHHD